MDIICSCSFAIVTDSPTRRTTNAEVSAAMGTCVETVRFELFVPGGEYSHPPSRLIRRCVRCRKMLSVALSGFIELSVDVSAVFGCSASVVGCRGAEGNQKKQYQEALKGTK